MAARFCQQADVERVLGGAAQLVQLLDKDQDGVADQALVDQVIDAASAEVASYVQITVDLSSLKAPYQLTLVFKTADVAAFHAWRYGAYGQAVPPNVVQGYEAAIRWAQDVGAKKATLGNARTGSLGQPTGVVDHDPDGRKVSIKGFQKGFR